MNNILIRRATIADLDCIYRFVCELENELFNYDSFGLIFKDNISNSEYAYFVAILNDNVVGFISYHTQNLLHHCGRVGEIQEFYIDKDDRNKGIGKLLMAEIDKYSQINNIESSEITSNLKRIENVTIYNNMGFRLTHNKFTK